MKKCPNCQKEFPDNMRFCQTDGTPLLDVAAESQAEDPLKTTVVRQEDIASSIPASDPFKTRVGNQSQEREESGDLLQLPEEFDPMKTMVVAPLGQNKPADPPKPETPRFEDIKEEIKSESSSPFDVFSQPSEPLPEAQDISNDPTVAQPEPPKFNEPSLSPPSFGGLSSSSTQDDDDLPQTVMQNPWDNAPKSNESPFSKPTDAPMSSPFDQPKSSFDEPKSSFDEPKPSFDAPQTPFGQPSSPFDAPQSSFDQPSSFDAPQSSYQEPANQFGSQFDQMNQGFGNQPLQQQNEWTPPAPPEQSWGNQNLGANTPFQPPVVGGAGQNKTMSIISLVTGILSCLCCFSIITGPVAIVLGVMARNKINAEPNMYTGAGLALGGIITGAVGTLIGIAAIILQLLGAFAGRF